MCSSSRNWRDHRSRWTVLLCSSSRPQVQSHDNPHGQHISAASATIEHGARIGVQRWWRRLHDCFRLYQQRFRLYPGVPLHHGSHVQAEQFSGANAQPGVRHQRRGLWLPRGGGACGGRRLRGCRRLHPRDPSHLQAEEPQWGVVPDQREPQLQRLRSHKNIPASADCQYKWHSPVKTQTLITSRVRHKRVVCLAVALPHHIDHIPLLDIISVTLSCSLLFVYLKKKNSTMYMIKKRKCWIQIMLHKCVWIMSISFYMQISLYVKTWKKCYMYLKMQWLISLILPVNMSWFDVVPL